MKQRLLTYLTRAGIIMALAGMAVSCKKDISTPQENAPAGSALHLKGTTKSRAVTYQLIWSDEFNGTSVDQSKWNFETGNPGVNNEDEYYQAANATVSNGNLVITAKHESVGGSQYTSARLNTSGKFSATYGRIEASIKLPQFQGSWPAFWMLGTDIGSVGWPQCGEIDIMEQVNTSNTIYGTIHWYDNGHVQYGGNTTTSANGYHLYAVEWDTNSINWYVDNNLYATANIANNINNTGAFHNPFFIILNMAVGGDFPGQTIDAGALPASMYVDYVRVYKGVTSGPPIGQEITLKGSNGDYVSSENGTQPITCNRTSYQAWEEFTWGTNADGTITLQGSNGDYVSSENGTQPMTCNRTTAQAWESFTVGQ